jgi:hypothetical protein
MAQEARIGGRRRPNPWRIAAWSIAALLLLLPLVAMQFTREVNWDAADFLFAGILIGSVGLLAELTVRTTTNLAFRAAVGFALAASFLIIWANGAVGMIGDEDNGYNLLFLGVIVLAFLGSIAARFRAAGMALAMLAAAIVHGGVALVGMQQDPRGGVFSLVFAGFWLFSAGLFHLAARGNAAASG